MPEKKTLSEDFFYKGSSAILPRLHTCENKTPCWDFSQFAVTVLQSRYYVHFRANTLGKDMNSLILPVMG